MATKPFNIFTTEKVDSNFKFAKPVLASQKPPARTRSAPRRPHSANYNGAKQRPKTGKSNATHHENDPFLHVSRYYESPAVLTIVSIITIVYYITLIMYLLILSVLFFNR